MIKKAFAVIKSNPGLVVFYLLYTLAYEVGSVLFMPNDYANNKDVGVMFAQLGKIYLFIGVSGIISLLVLSGAGHMLAEAVTKGKTSFANFFPGIKKFFWRVFLTMLLIFAMAIVFTIVLVIVGFILVLALNIIIKIGASGVQNTLVVAVSTIVFMSIIFLALIFVLPLYMLWFPAIFIEDSNISVAMRNGINAGKKNFGKLIGILGAIFIPVIGYLIYTFLTTGFSNKENSAVFTTFTPAYYAFVLVTTIVSLFVLPSLFIIYNEHKMRYAPIVAKIEEQGEGGIVEKGEGSGEPHEPQST
ncbi:MAG: hypothetical protein WCQ41_04510 [Bacillota bacterium]